MVRCRPGTVSKCWSLERSRTSGAPLRKSHSALKTRVNALKALRRIRDTGRLAGTAGVLAGTAASGRDALAADLGGGPLVSLLIAEK